MRPFRHRPEGAAADDKDGERQQLAETAVEDKKHRKYKEKPVNIHRVINLKKQYRQQVAERLDLVTKLEQNALEQDKAKLLKATGAASGKDKKRQEKNAARLLLKKRKHRESGSEGAGKSRSS